MNQNIIKHSISLSNIVSPLSIYHVTVDKCEIAEKLSKILVENRLVACSKVQKSVNNEGLIQSTYSWQGKVEVDREYLMILTSRTDLMEEICEKVIQNHPYDVPEIIATPILGGSKKYIDWVYEQTKEPEINNNKKDTEES